MTSINDALRQLREMFDPSQFDDGENPADPDPGNQFNPTDWAGPCDQCTPGECPYSDFTEYLN